jgi:hypothetical protein
MEYISWFLFSFILIYIIYYYFFIRKTRRNVKVTTEAQYLISIYKLDVNLFSYRKFMQIVGLVTSIDIALVATIVAKVDGIVWQILFGFVAVVPVVVLSFMLLGKYYQNKQLKDNSKELASEQKYLAKQSKKENKKKKAKKKGK